MGRKKQGYELNMKSVAAVTYAGTMNLIRQSEEGS